MIEENIKSPEIELISKNAKEEFIPCENQFRQLIENAPDGIAIVGTDGQFKYVSPSAKKIIGYDSEAKIAIDPNESTHPEDLNRVLNALNELVVDPSLVVTLQYRFLHSDGTWHWIESNFSNRLAEPGIEGFIINFRSIEERKKIEDELVKKETLYSTLFNLSPAGIMLEDMYGNIIDINDTYLAITGYRREELVGHNVRKIVPPEFLDEVEKNIASINSGETLIYEISTLRKDGTRIEIELRETMITLPNGEKGIIVVANDISERKRGEEILRRSENKYREIINGMTETVWVIDNDASIIDVNNSAVEMLGYTREELLSQGLEQIDKNLKIENIKQLVSNMPFDKIQIFETVHTSKQGEKIPVEISSSLINYENRTAVLSIARDITDRKKAETEIRLQSNMLNTIGQAVVSTDLQGHITYWNKAAEIIYGWTVNEVMGHYILDIIPSSVSEEQTKEIMRNLNERIAWSGEFSVNRKEGTVFPVFATTSPVLNEYGELIGIIATSIDITERINHIKMIEESSKQLRALSLKIEDLREEERTAIARELHDELGQLLTAIKIDLQTIANHPPAKKDLAETVNPVLNLVEESIISIRKLSSDLRPTVLDHLGLVSSMEWYISEQKKRLRIDFNFKKPNDIRKVPMKKTVPVFRVFQELLTNIARHAKASKVDVIMEVKNSNMKLIVSDNGVGMDPAAIDNIKSLGILGMKERLNVIGGTLSYSSQPGKGTDAEVIVPFIYCDETVNMAEQIN